MWYLPGIFRLGSALGGGECGSPWTASCAWRSPFVGADSTGFILCFLEEGGCEREGREEDSQYSLVSGEYCLGWVVEVSFPCGRGGSEVELGLSEGWG